jgi:hypothetical protein
MHPHKLDRLPARKQLSKIASRTCSLTALAGLLCGPATALASGSSTTYVSSRSNLYNDWLYPTGGAWDATPVAGLEVVNGATVTISATGCASLVGSNCFGPNGTNQVYRGLPVYSLIGAWSTSPTELTGSTVVGQSFFIGSSATLAAPSGPGPYYLFVAFNDGHFADNSTSTSYGYTLSTTWEDAVVDTDGDGVADDDDNCPANANADQLNSDGDGYGDVCDLCVGDDDAGDFDFDGYCDNSDNCPTDANADQADFDGDAIGDICEADTDGDGVIDDDDNCPADANASQADNEGDGLGDVCDIDDDDDGVMDDEDNCWVLPNVDQADFDADGQGDACDGDDDADGVSDAEDFCPATPFDAIYNDDGCSGEQLVDLACWDRDPCAFPNHGQFQKCVVNTVNNARDAGLLTNTERAAIVKSAAKTVCE